MPEPVVTVSDTVLPITRKGPPPYSAMPLATQGDEITLYAKVLCPLGGPPWRGDQLASESSPLLRISVLSTIEFVVPLQKFTASAIRSRKRHSVMRNCVGPCASAARSTQNAHFMCSTHTRAMVVPSPGRPVNALPTSDLSLRCVVSPKMDRSDTVAVPPVK